jgi:hypothetical protein
MLYSDVLMGGEDLKAPRLQYACWVMPAVNTSEEPVTIQAGTAMATASPWEESEGDEGRIRILGPEKRGQVITPVIERIREWNSKVPELLRQKLQHLSAKEREVVEPVILEYQEIFKRQEDGKILCTTYGCHEIKRGDAPPVKRQAYRCPYMLKEEMKRQIGEMKRQIGEMKDKGVISETAAEWSAPVILVSKNPLMRINDTISSQIFAD